MVECPKCGGEIREGAVLVLVTTSAGQASSSFGPMSIPGIGIPTGETTREERILWREKTGQKTGRLIKSEEEKTMKIYGRRCLKCGYIELYVQE